MKKRVLICILAVCFAFSPVSAFAQAYAVAPFTADEGDLAAGEEGEEQTAEVKFVKSEQQKLADEPEIGCKAAYLADPVTGKVIYEKNAHDTMYPASTTKILTALVTLENCKLDETAVVSKEAHDLINEGYSNAMLQTGEEHTIYTLLQALLIPSANEAAIVLAEHISGSVGAFAELCNKRAKELGCEQVHFVNPNGLHDKMHFCTAYDLYLIAKECQKYDAFNEIVQMTEFTVPETKVYPNKDRKFENTNELILPDNKNFYPYCTGIKTGHTTPAGECLVSSASNDGMNLICVVLGGSIKGEVNERFYDTVQLYNFAYKNYSYQTIVEPDQVFTTVEVANASDDAAQLDLVSDTEITTLVPNGFSMENIEPVIDIKQDVTAPVSEGDVIGTATIKADGLNYTINLVAANDVHRQNQWVIYCIIAAGAAVAVIVIVAVVKSNRKISIEE